MDASTHRLLLRLSDKAIQSARVLIAKAQSILKHCAVADARDVALLAIRLGRNLIRKEREHQRQLRNARGTR